MSNPKSPPRLRLQPRRGPDGPPMPSAVATFPAVLDGHRVAFQGYSLDGAEGSHDRP